VGSRSVVGRPTVYAVYSSSISVMIIGIDQPSVAMW
jgi:hypothetical protein